MSGTRRSFWREVGNPLTMFHEERKHGERGDPKWSMKRVIPFIFAVVFCFHWPDTWNDAARDVVAILVFALSVQLLLSMIPVGEALAATQAFFGKVMGRNLKEASDSVAVATADIPAEEPST